MASYYWIKLYHEILDDPKMGRLPDRTWRRCIEFFLLAGDNERDGDLPPMQDMAWRLRIPEDELAQDLEALRGVGIVDCRDDGTWYVVRFKDRQNAMTSAERVKRHRSRERLQRFSNDNNETECNAECNDNETDCYTDINTDEEKKREDTDTENPLSADTAGAVTPQLSSPEQKVVNPSSKIVEMREKSVSEIKRLRLKLSEWEALRDFEQAQENPRHTLLCFLDRKIANGAPLNNAEREYLALFGANGFQTPAQRETLKENLHEYGREVVMQFGNWAALKPLTIGASFSAMSNALPKWNGRGKKIYSAQDVGECFGTEYEQPSELDTLWRGICNHLRGAMTRETFDANFGRASPVSLDNGVLTIFLPAGSSIETMERLGARNIIIRFSECVDGVEWIL